MPGSALPRYAPLALGALIALALHLPPATLQAQALDASAQELYHFNQQRLDLNLTAMSVLMGWSLVNMAGGLTGRALTQGRARAFHEWNFAWNIVNAGIAGFALWDTSGMDPGSFDAVASIQEIEKIQKILLVNVGLDVAYLVGGAWLVERGRRVGSPRQEGWGLSTLLQGGFLMAFDISLVVLNAGLAEDLYLTLDPAPGGGATAALLWTF